VESVEYSYSFDDALEQEWNWTERYAGQPEILRYLDHVADRFDLRPLIRFDTRVTTATFAEATSQWSIETDDCERTTARFFVMATGCLSSANLPAIEGLADFEGGVFHTGRWPHDGVAFAGRRVGVIGTGSSGIQAIPVIAAEAAHLTVFQRTPNYSVPARNAPLDPSEQTAIKADYSGLRERNLTMATGFGSRFKPGEPSALAVEAGERDREFEARWRKGGFQFLGSYADLLIDRTANDTAAEFVRRKIAETVADPKVAAMLTPSQVIGCKRLCLDTGYFETFNRDNVELIDINDTPIERVTRTGVQTTAEHVDVDCLVFATGFDAMTGALLAVDIRGRDGASLRDAWREGPRTYLGLGVPGFPNMFIITGPGSPSVLTNMVVSIEQHVDWIAACLEHLRAHDIASIEATADATEGWVAYVNMVADLTLFPTCNSWYLGSNIPGKRRVFMPLPGFPPYAEQCAGVAADGYRGFALGGRQ
jgi:cyclohexanone monooxygenase